jgi:hypothetical protein
VKVEGFENPIVDPQSEHNRKAYHHYLAAYNLTGPMMDPDWEEDYNATLTEVELLHWNYRRDRIHSEWRYEGKRITITEVENLEVELHMWYEEEVG